MPRLQDLGAEISAATNNPVGVSLSNLGQPRENQADILARNQPYVAPGGPPMNTQLAPMAELEFRNWLSKNKVPFDPDAPVSDYDMRGFYSALKSGDPRAASAVNPNDNQMHYPDYWKTPYHETFSRESQWAGPVAPAWNSLDQLVSPGARIVVDERARR